MKRQPATSEFLDPDEFLAALESLSSDDKLKLADIEAIRLRGTGFEPGELIQETVFRTLNGTRNCPRDVLVVAYVAQTMRSIASHDRDQRRRESSLEELQLVGTAGSNQAVESSVPSPEDDLVHKQDDAAVQSIYRCFEDDPEAQLVLLGWQEDLRGSALREATGLEQGQLDYAIRRIRTRMRRAYPKGWMV